jgi:hypothetical protein
LSASTGLDKGTGAGDSEAGGNGEGKGAGVSVCGNAARNAGGTDQGKWAGGMFIVLGLRICVNYYFNVYCGR